MKEILFKAKSRVTKEWIMGDLHLSSKSPHIHFTPSLSEPIDIETICQYINKEDVDGNKIFEGDIVEGYGDKYIVQYDHYDARFEYTNIDREGWRSPYNEIVKVIGNIHDEEYKQIKEELEL